MLANWKVVSSWDMFTSALVISGFPGILTGNSTSVVVPILSLTSFDMMLY